MEQPLVTDYFNHFVRGYFDGDGTLHYNHSNNSPYVTILGTESFIKGLNYAIKEPNVSNGGTVSKRKSSPNLWELTYGGTKSTVEMLDWMYQDSESTMRLDRKYFHYLQIRN